MKSFARMLIVGNGGKILAVEQRYLGGTTWNFPGGKIDPDEPPCFAAQREVFEELGISCPLRMISYFLRHTVRIDGEEWRGYYCCYSGPIPRVSVREPEKILSTAWVTLSEAKELNAFHSVFSDVFELALRRIPHLLVGTCWQPNPLSYGSETANPWTSQSYVK